MRTEYVILYKGVVVSSAEDMDDLLQTLFEHYVDSKAVRDSDFQHAVSLASAEIEIFALSKCAKVDLEEYAKEWCEMFRDAVSD